jgi:hypothetical protein
VFDDGFPGEQLKFVEPMPDVVWMRYELTLKAMDKRFDDVGTLLNYVMELENFIFSAYAPLPDAKRSDEGSS